MANTKELQEEELKSLTETEDVSLEALITEGANLQIPITFNYPSKKGIVERSAIIRPLTSAEWEECTNYALKHKKGFALKILEKGFLNSDGEPLTMDLLKLMPSGVVNELYTRIADVSGVKQDKEEQYQLTKELMGF